MRRSRSPIETHSTESVESRHRNALRYGRPPVTVRAVASDRHFRLTVEDRVTAWASRVHPRSVPSALHAQRRLTEERRRHRLDSQSHAPMRAHTGGDPVLRGCVAARGALRARLPRATERASIRAGRRTRRRPRRLRSRGATQPERAVSRRGRKIAAIVEPTAIHIQELSGSCFEDRDRGCIPPSPGGSCRLCSRWTAGRRLRHVDAAGREPGDPAAETAADLDREELAPARARPGRPARGRASKAAQT